MKIVEVESTFVRGLHTRTKNSDEVSPSTARIGNLWGQFYSLVADRMRPEMRKYGVYYQYESDFSGEFNVLVGTDSNECVEPELRGVKIESGKYAVFARTGDMPKAVIDAWSEVWDYFSATSCPYERAYITDFELYKGLNEVDLYIAVKPHHRS